ARARGEPAGSRRSSRYRFVSGDGRAGARRLPGWSNGNTARTVKPRHARGVERISRMNRRRVVIPILALAAACSGNSSAPVAAACGTTGATQVSLAPTGYQLVNAASSNCLQVGANSTVDTAEYLVVGQSAGGVPGDSASFTLKTGGPGATAAFVSPLTRALAERRLARGSVVREFEARMHARRAAAASQLRVEG